MYRSKGRDRWSDRNRFECGDRVLELGVRSFDRDNPDYAWFECPRPITHAFERQPDAPLTAVSDSAATILMLDPTLQYQTILGTGISMEEASVANLRALSRPKRDEMLTRMFDPVNGMGLQVVRVTIGTSDYTGQDWYTYDDGAPDPYLARFSIAKDVDDGIVDVLQQIRAISPGVVFFASPWSPPAWMKEGGRITGGRLESGMIPVYAAYLRKFVEAYRDVGIPIYALTLQNEPRSDNPAMPSCFVPAEQEAAIAIAVKQELANAGLTTKVWIYDHNFDAALDYTGDLFATGSDLMGGLYLFRTERRVRSKLRGAEGSKPRSLRGLYRRDHRYFGCVVRSSPSRRLRSRSRVS